MPAAPLQFWFSCSFLKPAALHCRTHSLLNMHVALMFKDCASLETRLIKQQADISRAVESAGMHQSSYMGEKALPQEINLRGPRAPGQRRCCWSWGGTPSQLCAVVCPELASPSTLRLWECDGCVQCGQLSLSAGWSFNLSVPQLLRMGGTHISLSRDRTTCNYHLWAFSCLKLFSNPSQQGVCAHNTGSSGLSSVLITVPVLLLLSGF